MQGTTTSGAAAEAYVHYRLRSWGIDAHFAGGIASPFDLWAEYEGKILKIQIKSSRKISKRGNYFFSTKKGHSGLYAPEDWDIMALVALPEQAAWFTLRGDVKARRLPPESFSEKQERETWDRVINQIKEDQNE